MTPGPSMLSLAQNYLDERRRLGFALTIEGEQLVNFAHFADRTGHHGPLTIQLMIAWAQGEAKRATPANWSRRMEVLRPFARYCAQVEPDTEIPCVGVLSHKRRRPTPHIYTVAEIEDLLAAARRLPPPGTLRPLTYETFFGLIAATGLRFSETLRLRCGDFDVGSGTLTIRQTKFCKSRLVPLHPTTIAAVSKYLSVRRRISPAVPEAPLFMSPSGAALVSSTVHNVFSRLRAELGWAARGTLPMPRIHDLRHSFVCRRVTLWHETGADIDNSMLALSTYVGHAKVSDTYWYLTAEPDLMGVAGKRFEAFAVADVGEVRHV